MIDLYTWTTPNGRKISIALEELGLPYKVIPVNLQKEEQFSPAFTAINPNQKIPAIVDHDGSGWTSFGVRVGRHPRPPGREDGPPPAEGGTRPRHDDAMAHVPDEPRRSDHRADGALREPGAGEDPYAIQRFVGESVRIVGVLNTGLQGRDHLAGDYSIADIATYPWIVAAWEPFRNMMPEKIGEFGNVQRWLDRLGARPAVQRGMAIPAVS